MNLLIRNLIACFTVLAVLCLAVPGCNPAKDPASKPKKEEEKKDEKKHDHSEKGPHDGPLAEWGEDDFHVEFKIYPATKEAVIYVLDDKAKNAPKIAPEKIEDVSVSIPSLKIAKLKLTHDAKRSDEKGIAFAGTDEAFAKAAELKGTINGKVNGVPYSGDFPLKIGK